MKMNTDREWLLIKSEQEDGCMVSVGGLTYELEENQKPSSSIMRSTWNRGFTYVNDVCIRQRKRETLEEFRARVFGIIEESRLRRWKELFNAAN